MRELCDLYIITVLVVGGRNRQKSTQKMDGWMNGGGGHTKHGDEINRKRCPLRAAKAKEKK
jgi:hypothetical protein